MVLGEAAAAGAAGVHALWDYNRSNFLYDREMRQEQEFQVLEYRNRQAELWREDVRDLVGLTERKMDSYLVVGTVQLGMCVTLFTEGRLEPGTPQWLLRLYVLSLGGAFVYLLLSVWLAMHASVVAQSASVRLLTQLVRLPVPSWEQLEATRTYANSYEELRAGQVLRVPFMESFRGAAAPPGGGCSPASLGGGGAPAAPSPAAARGAETPGPGAAVDPWGLEREGGGIYELQQKPTALLRHVKLVRRAAAQYQCHDAFARVSMTVGTNQLLFATTYYCLGYMTVQDGAPWPAFAAAAVLVSVAAGLVRLDLSLSPQERLQAQALIATGPACSAVACCAWGLYTPAASAMVQMLLPAAFLAHGLLLLWVLKVCGVQQQPNGAMLPTKFRAVLYLDVFGWLVGRGQPRAPVGDGGGVRPEWVARAEAADGLGLGLPLPTGPPHAMSPAAPPAPSPPMSSSREASLRLREEQLRRDVELWESEKVQGLVDEEDRTRIGSLAQQLRSVLSEDLEGGAGAEGRPPGMPPPPPARWLRLRGYADTGEEVAYLYDASSSSVVPAGEEAASGPSATLEAAAVGRGARAPQPLSLSFTEEQVNTFCERKRARSSPSAAPRAAQDPSSPTFARARGLLEWCEEPTLASSPSSQHASVPLRLPLTRLGPAGAGGAASPQAAASVASSSRAARRSAHLTMTYAQPSEEFGHQPMRPEDVEEAAAELEAGLHQARLQRGWQDDHRALRGVGPAAAVPPAPHDTFDPTSYYPDGHAAASDARIAGPAEEVVTGHDKMKPGQMPWHAFRAATRLFAGCWAFACLLALPGANRWLGLHTLTLPQVMATVLRESGRAPGSGDSRSALGAGEPESGLPLLSAVGEERARGDLPLLPGGEPLSVEWPRQFSFAPRSLGCDPTGRQLVVADDFGIYAGRLEEVEEVVEPTPGGANASASGGASPGRPLHGALGAELLRVRLPTGAPGPSSSKAASDAPPRKLLARFSREPPCTALEGQTLKDIGLACSSGSSCHVLVLHARGRLLADCPLAVDQPLHAAASAPHGAGLFPPATDGALVGTAPPPQPWAIRPSIVWEISGGWLNATQERVESVAIDGGCGGTDAITPDDPGCVVVGTTSGRIVQLRRHVSDEHQLVPEWAMGRRPRKVGQGSLHVLEGGFVISLRPGLGTLQALDAWEGTGVGEWRLPAGVEWCALCGGGDSLFILGRKGPRREAALWRFAMPAELEARRRKRREPARGTGASAGRYHEM